MPRPHGQPCYPLHSKVSSCWMSYLSPGPARQMLLFCVTGLSRCQGLRSPSKRQQTGPSTLVYRGQRRTLRSLGLAGPVCWVSADLHDGSFPPGFLYPGDTVVPQWPYMHAVHLSLLVPCLHPSATYGEGGFSPLWLLQNPYSGLRAVPSEAIAPGHQTRVRTATGSILETMPKRGEMGVLL